LKIKCKCTFTFLFLSYFFAEYFKDFIGRILPHHRLSPLELLKIILAKRNKGKQKVPHFPVALKALLSFFNLVALGYMR
jgi:hypothetical protein